MCIGGEVGAALWDLRCLSDAAQPQPYADLLTIPKRNVRPECEPNALTFTRRPREVYDHAGSELAFLLSFGGSHGHGG